ncbi:TolC family protein [Patiriisocius hiemis]|uniref:TolC family protein n=1 Tax=Patiriisocius hiemis TaxID=3075604 RepID=A0ABU2Y9F5_9FLAO|nr:TolC family protein [Constantimarinum sp. W242]MDT0554445.1 TolC family protein [Constantimarinum sp. W242]
MKKFIFYSFLWLSYGLTAQPDTIVLTFKEYLGYVKKHHPIVKQAELTLEIGEANLLRARGGFDPKIEVDYSRKKFKEREYYDLLNATFKIPIWYGIEFKADFEENTGLFLNPQNNVPVDGLYSAGVSLSLAQGLLVNDRMATLRKAKFFNQQSKADRDLLVNKILFKASLAYFDWLKSYNEVKIYDSFLMNARTRFNGIAKSARVGERAAIDTVEAKIIVQNRELSLEQARLSLIKKKLELSNFLWIENNIPLELEEKVIPDVELLIAIDAALQIENKPLSDFDISTHPKLKSLENKLENLQVDKRLKANKLLPKVDLEYNFLSQTPEIANSFNTANYKAGLQISFPLFLRKERGDLKLAKFKVQDATFELTSQELEIKNKITAIYNEINSYDNQINLIQNIVLDYEKLVAAEERKLSFGESSIFLINSREKSLIDAKLKTNEIMNKMFVSKAKLFNSLMVDLIE